MANMVLNACQDEFKAFFEMDSADKREYALEAGSDLGYSVARGKELFTFCAGPNSLPQGKTGRASDAFGLLEHAARTVLSAVYRALGHHSCILAPCLDDLPLQQGQASSSVMHVSCYDPEPAAGSPATSTAARAFAPHVDRGLLTLVASREPRGLQVKVQATAEGAAAGGAEEWVDVALGPGRVAVLVGYSLEHATGGALRAATHRVLRGKRGGERRKSIAFKLRARLDGPPLLPGPAGQPALTARQLMERYQAERPLSVNAPAAAYAYASIPATNAQPQQVEDPDRPAQRGQPEPATQHSGGPPQQAAAPRSAAELQGQTQGAIMLFVKDQGGNEVQFQLKRNTKMGLVMQAYAIKKNVNIGELTFKFDGTRVLPTHTAADLELKDGDFVDVFKEQLGD